MVDDLDEEEEEVLEVKDAEDFDVFFFKVLGTGGSFNSEASTHLEN